MSSTATVRLRYAAIGVYFRNESVLVPPGFKLSLITAAGVGTSGSPVAPNATNCAVFASCSANELPNGNGYTTGGIALSRNSTDFSTYTEDTGSNQGIIGVRTCTWTASGGNLPASGTGAAYAILYDTNVAKNVVAIFDLGGNRTVSDGQQLILQNLQILAGDPA